MKIGFLGLGKMGTPMARHLLAAGHELRVWNRTEGQDRTAAPRRARLPRPLRLRPSWAPTPSFTMLFDDAANEEVIFGANGLMDALSPGALHISCSTISVALSERLTAGARAPRA
jgi:3-hydroxyisobutyrate dehydrogenase-like beta-hydroxyacid dehydrogenase